MNNRYSLSTLIHDYIDIFRGIQLEQGNAITTYLNSQREMNASLNALLLRYLEIERTTRNFSQPPPPPSLFSFNSNNNRAPSQSPINNSLNAPYTFNWPSNNTSTTNTRINTPTTRNIRSLQPRDIPITTSRNTTTTRIETRTGTRSGTRFGTRTGTRSGTRTRRRPPRITATTNITATRIPRNVFQNFINNTLNIGNNPQPLSSADISSNVTNLIFRDLNQNNSQTICPFTQDNFQENDEISRIEPCGHIFTRSHLHRYLSHFDYRCPVCRRDLRRENDVENPTPPVTNLLDLSSNFSVLPTSNNSQETRTIINNAVESVTNALVNNLTNQITNDPSRNSLVAEYSFFLPANLTDNLTSNFTTTANDDLHDYLGLPPRNNSTQTPSSVPLPPLPEDSENELPELIDHFSDEEDL
tara:strand:- start:4502 stop:5746 length:1245 start_codon:yes stop_codon:yes gene_type:complete